MTTRQNSLNAIILAAALFSTQIPSSLTAQTAGEMRVWVSQEGTTVKAQLLDVTGTDVHIKTEAGGTIKVAISRLSAVDQKYVQAWLSANNGLPETPIVTTTPQVAANTPQSNVPLVWPTIVQIDTKSLSIETGEQIPAQRRFVYRCGPFQFTSQAPLADSVMRDVASDFELTYNLFKTLPWGWVPLPPDDDKYYFAELYETQEDYITAGGGDNSSGYSKGNLFLTKFATLGLKKVGGRYAQDAKEKNNGAIVSLVSRLVMADMRSYCSPWSCMGMEEMLEYAVYRGGAFDFTRAEQRMKERISNVTKRDTVKTDVPRMVKFFRSSWDDYRSDAVDIRRQNYLDGMLLVYFFGYLDGDAKGTKLHEYYRAASLEAMGWRKYRETRAESDRPSGSGNYKEISERLMQTLAAGRSDEELIKQITDKYRSIGVKL